VAIAILSMVVESRTSDPEPDTMAGPTARQLDQRDEQARAIAAQMCNPDSRS